MSNSDFQLQKTPVLVRDESPAKLFGFTPSEWRMLTGVFFFVIIFIKLNFFGIGVMLLTVFYIKQIKASLPDNYISNAIKFYWSGVKHFRANMPDVEWRPPILGDRRRPAFRKSDSPSHPS